MSRKRLTLSTGLRKMTVNQEKVRPMGLKGASSKALDPQGSYRSIPKLISQIAK